ncbi:TniB family NTP-binding protein [Kitasatospora sp. NPDC002040]|uniref:TniB family NTP-binding protein n=1 Tax=Kitasatospora sp. NPDC002040 TaxID=3154661 RepID=UPI003316FF2F
MTMSFFAHPGLSEPRTKEEWRSYLHAVPPRRPGLTTLDAYVAMAKNERDEFNHARHDYHSALVLIRTGQMRRHHSVIERRMRVNSRQAAGARRGIVLDGPPTVGKSTLIKLYAADYERALRHRHPERFATNYEVSGRLIDYTPVVYLNIPTKATPKHLSMLLADYLAMPYRSGATMVQITNAVLDTLRWVGTELVIIDDVHFLDLSARDGKVANEHLKYLANHTAATFVYTGADLKTSGLFLEGRGSTQATQTSGRNTLLHVTPFGRTTQDQTEWVQTIMALENTLCLFDHRPGTLPSLHRYLYDRTQGSICALSDLIRESAIEAVDTGAEAVSEALMDTIEISHAAQAAYTASVSRRPVRKHHAATTAS